VPLRAIADVLGPAEAEKARVRLTVEADIRSLAFIGRQNVTAGFSIRLLAALPETPLNAGPDGTLARSLGVPLDGAPPGRYEAIVVVTDLAAGRAAEAREPFEIEAPAGRE
jgi:hypothetical protein